MTEVLVGLGSALSTAFAQWVFYYRKHKGNADRTEIENYKLIAQEWRESAQIWKDLADQYQLESIQNKKKIEKLEEELRALKRQLTSASKRINHLEMLNEKH